MKVVILNTETSKEEYGPKKRLSRCDKIINFAVTHFVLWHDFKDICFFFISFLIFASVGILCYLSNANSALKSYTTRHPDADPLEIIHDPILLIMNKLTYRFPAWFFSIFRSGPVAAAILLMAFRLVTLGNNSLSRIRRVFTILSILYLVRAATVSLTIIPSPESKVSKCEYVVKSNSWDTMSSNFARGKESCTDVFYSGHSVIFTVLIYIYYIEPFNWRPKLVQALVYAFSCFGYFSLILSSIHYTNDVLASIWFTASTIRIYTWCIGLPDLRYKWYSKWLKSWEHCQEPKQVYKWSSITTT